MMILQPLDWKRAKGYSNGLVARGDLIFVAGQVGWNADQEFESDDFVPQAKQALENIASVLDQAGAKPENIARLTWYVISREEYFSDREGLGAVYREIMGDHYPVMTAIEVQALMPSRARLEIEATAVIPAKD